MIGRSGWLVVGATLCVVAHAGQPPPATPQTPPPSSSGDVPDAEFIEFLGADDHGDAAWWEFLKKTPPADSSTPPPEDAKR